MNASHPLEERLSRLLATIPLDIQREGLSLASLQASLWGRWRGNCHPGELGSSLRKLDFKRERRWHNEGGFQAVWRSKDNSGNVRGADGWDDVVAIWGTLESSQTTSRADSELTHKTS